MYESSLQTANIYKIHYISQTYCSLIAKQEEDYYFGENFLLLSNVHKNDLENKEL